MSFATERRRVLPRPAGASTTAMRPCSAEASARNASSASSSASRSTSAGSTRRSVAQLRKFRVKSRVVPVVVGAPHCHDRAVAGEGSERSWASAPRAWLEGAGTIGKFSGRIVGHVYTGRVLRFFGEALRQAGILILGSTLVIWGLVFIIGLQCGIEGAYLLRAQGAPAYAGVFAAWCDLRELVPYGFGYMMAAKVGTCIVAELGSM